MGPTGSRASAQALFVQPWCGTLPYLDVQLYGTGRLVAAGPHVGRLVVLAAALVVLRDALVVHLRRRMDDTHT
jgi:hypothetical protein